VKNHEGLGGAGNTILPNVFLTSEMFIRDTDTITIQVGFEGHHLAKVILGSFDCLFCSCPLAKIALEAIE